MSTQSAAAARLTLVNRIMPNTRRRPPKRTRFFRKSTPLLRAIARQCHFLVRRGLIVENGSWIPLSARHTDLAARTGANTRVSEGFESLNVAGFMGPFGWRLGMASVTAPPRVRELVNMERSTTSRFDAQCCSLI